MNWRETVAEVLAVAVILVIPLTLLAWVVFRKRR